MESLLLTRDQALNLWSGSTDSKTLDYQRTTPKQYQIVRTHTKDTTWIQDPASPNHQCRTPHLNNKQNKNTNQIISRQDYHLTQPCPSEEKQTNKNSAQISPYTHKAHTNHWTNLRRAETKRKKEFNLLQGKNSTFLEAWEKETSNTIIFKK